jgi:tungstate transport system permease protein
MSLPTVVVGLMVYSFLSRRGPLGDLGLLYTVTAMVVGQCILAFPIVTGLTISSVKGLDKRIKTTIKSLGADPLQGFLMFLHEGRFGILAAVIAGFGRVFAEIGVSMMLGGNIKGYTRNITTAIALETSKGEFALGIALGLVLLIVAFGVNILLSFVQRKAQ